MELDSDVEVGHSRLLLLQTTVRTAACVVSVSILRVNPDDLVALLDGIRIVPDIEMLNRKVMAQRAVVWFYTHGFLVVCDGFVAVPEFPMRDGTPVEGVGIQRINPDGLIELTDGLLVFAHPNQSGSVFCPDIRIIGTQPCRCLQIGDGLFVLAQLRVIDCPVAVRCSVARIEPNGLRVGSDGRLQLALIAQVNAFLVLECGCSLPMKS